MLNLEYGVSDEMAREVRLACGGDIKVFVERCPERAMLEKLRDSQPIARVVDTQSGKTALLDHDNLEGDLDDQKLSDARLLLKHGTSGSIGSKFVKVYARPRNLVIVGAVHIAQTLAPMAAAIGFHVSVIDPRPKFATPERLPGVTIITDRPAMAVDHIALDNWAAVVALAHDPLLDDPVLVAALLSPKKPSPDQTLLPENGGTIPCPGPRRQSGPAYVAIVGNRAASKHLSLAPVWPGTMPW